jgi:hypothetical protein
MIPRKFCETLIKLSSRKVFPRISNSRGNLACGNGPWRKTKMRQSLLNRRGSSRRPWVIKIFLRVGGLPAAVAENEDIGEDDFLDDCSSAGGLHDNTIHDPGILKDAHAEVFKRRLFRPGRRLWLRRKLICCALLMKPKGRAWMKSPARMPSRASGSSSKWSQRFSNCTSVRLSSCGLRGGG